MISFGGGAFSQGTATHRLALGLGAVAVDGGGGEAVADQEVLQRVGTLLGLHKDQGQALRSRRSRHSARSRRRSCAGCGRTRRGASPARWEQQPPHPAATLAETQPQPYPSSHLLQRLQQVQHHLALVLAGHVLNVLQAGEGQRGAQLR